MHHCHLAGGHIKLKWMHKPAYKHARNALNSRSLVCYVSMLRVTWCGSTAMRNGSVLAHSNTKRHDAVTMCLPKGFIAVVACLLRYCLGFFSWWCHGLFIFFFKLLCSLNAHYTIQKRQTVSSQLTICDISHMPAHTNAGREKGHGNKHSIGAAQVLGRRNREQQREKGIRNRWCPKWLWKQRCCSAGKSGKSSKDQIVKWTEGEKETWNKRRTSKDHSAVHFILNAKWNVFRVEMCLLHKGEETAGSNREECELKASSILYKAVPWLVKETLLRNLRITLLSRHTLCPAYNVAAVLSTPLSAK